MKIYSCRDKSKRQKQYPPGCAILPPPQKSVWQRDRLGLAAVAAAPGHRRGPLQLPVPGLALLWHRRCAGSVGTFPVPLRL